jgi:hypothetical protein
MSSAQTRKKRLPLWTVGILANVVAATMLIFRLTSGH